MAARARRTGRRPGQPDTREQILRAARQLFSTQGYEAASLRAIAGEAGVDSALISHYFGGKEGLFEAAMELPFNPAALVAEAGEVGPEELPAKIAEMFVGVWEHPVRGPIMVSLLRRGVSTPGYLAAMRQFMVSGLLRPAVTRAGGRQDDLDLRISLVVAHLIGTVTMRHIFRFEPLASLDRERLRAYLAAGIDRHLNDDLPFTTSEGTSS